MAIIKNHLFETLREEDGVKIQLVGRAFLIGAANAIIFWGHPAENLDLDPLAQHIQECNVFYTQYNQRKYGEDYLTIRLDQYSKPISLPSEELPFRTRLRR